MKKLLLLLLFIPLMSIGQEFVSKKSNFITITGVASENLNKTYWKIDENDVTQFLNKKMTKIFETHKLGITETDDWKIKWSFDKDKNQLIKRGMDTFTEKTYKITYHLTLIE